MLDLERYESLGEALRDALERYAEHVCLIEADRDRENCRLTYREFGERAQRLASALQEEGFAPDERTAIIMSNQSKWLISAYAVFYVGGVLVPLDYKLSPREQSELLRHARASVLITEFPLWRALRQEVSDLPLRRVLVTEAPPEADLGDAVRWEEFRSPREPAFVPRRRQDVACIVYSSGTGGRPKGCLLTHENYLEQCRALTALYPFSPQVRYLSILPTNHAIDFMVGFIGPFVCGATVVHLRTLRPEYIREAFVRYKITHMSLVPMILKNLERGLRERFAALPRSKRIALSALMRLNRFLTRKRPNVRLSRRLFPEVHRAFGGELQMLIVGGAFTEPSTLQFFYDLGIPVANGYGLTEACTAVTVNDLRPFRADTVGRPLPGVEVKILNPDAEGIGEVAVRGKNVMLGYWDDPELTAETLREGWLLTGDFGWIDETGHLHLVGRKKNMIVTEGGKNIYPEDVERFFEGLPVREFCIFAENYIWPERRLGNERLLLVVHPHPGQEVSEDLHRAIQQRNRQLPEYKRVHGYLVWERDFPRTASLKIKRTVLSQEIRTHADRSLIRPL